MAAKAVNSLWLFLISSIVYLAGMAAIVWAFARWIDHRNPLDFGFHFNKKWLMDFGIGLLLGAFTLSAVFFIEWKMGWLKISSVNRSVFNESFVLIGLTTFISLLAIAVGEEITFRSYQIKNLSEVLSGKHSGRKSVLIALFETSVIFGLAHMGNPNATLMAFINIILAGLLLGLGFILTGELALPIGLHLTWGFFESFIYGYANSGQMPMSWVIGSKINGPKLWTGGPFGPEAGLLVTILLIFDALFIVAWIKISRKKIEVRSDLAEYHETNDLTRP